MILNSCCLAENLQNVKKKIILIFGGGGGEGGGKINRPGQPAPGVEDNQGGGQDIPGYLAPWGASCPGEQDKLLHRYQCDKMFLSYENLPFTTFLS